MASIKRTGDGEYFVRISKGTGKGRIFINKKIRGTKQQAQAFAREKETLLDLGYSPKAITYTFEDYFKLWLKALKQRVAPSTLDWYEGIITRYVLDDLRTLKLADIKTHHLQTILDTVIGKYSSVTVHNLKTALNACFRYAVRKEYRETNPVKNCETPVKTQKEKVVMSFEEAKSFIDACQVHKNGIIFEFALETGMRPEEYLALRWKDVDFHRHHVSVTQAVAHHRQGGGYYFKEPKTKRSRRLIPITPELRQKLMNHKREQNERCLQSYYINNDLVFASLIGEPYRLSNITRRYFYPILETIGFRKDGKVIKNLTVYSLRHTCATLLLMSGINVKVVSERLGHASTALTLDVYSHVLPTMQESATNEIGSILRGAKM